MARLILAIGIILLLNCGPSAEVGSENALSQSQIAAEPAEGTPIPVPSDPRARYFHLEQRGTAAVPIVLTKRVGPSGISYALREYDCERGTFRYLAEGESRESVESRSIEGEMDPLVTGSISYYVGRFACSEQP